MLGLIGAGNMARALARGLDEPLLICDSGSGRAQALAEEIGGEALATSAEVAARANLVLLCHKPAQLEDVAQAIGGRARSVISLLGGVTVERLRSAYPGAAVLRTMPNTAVEVRAGVTCLCAEPDTDRDLLARARDLFGRVGHVVALPERLIDLATAISGVGPAYTALVAEAQVEAAIRHGMGPALASELVTHTLAGSAALLTARGGDTLAVRREVTSPGGMTARGLDALERAGIRGAFGAALDQVLGGGA